MIFRRGVKIVKRNLAEDEHDFIVPCLDLLFASHPPLIEAFLSVEIGGP